MELRRYWQIIMRYWWLVLVLLLAGLAAAYQYYTANRPTYTNTVTVNITRDPTPNETYSGYYANVSSEYVADDFTQVVVGSTFLNDVSALLKARGINVSGDTLKGLIEVERKHRELYVTAHNQDEGTSLAINRAIADTLVSNAGKYIPYNNGAQPIKATLINMPTSAPLSGWRTLLLAAVRPIVGLIVGLALVFLLAYLDNTMRSAAEVSEVTGLKVLAEIPKQTARRTNGTGNGSDNGSPSPEPEREKIAQG